MIEVLLNASALLAAIGAIALVAGTLGVIAQSKYVGAPIRWLWQRNVSGPIGEWNRRLIGDVVDERVDYLMHHRNNGSSLLDLAEAVKAVQRNVTRLLRHDDERDVQGLRYGPSAEKVEEAIEVVEQLLKYDDHEPDRTNPDERNHE